MKEDILEPLGRLEVVSSDNTVRNLASQEIGRSRVTCARWEAAAWWPAAQAAALATLATRKDVALHPLLPAALERIAEALQSPDLNISVPAAWKIIEHIYGKAHQAVDVTSTSDISPELDALIRLKLGQPAIPGSTVVEGVAHQVTQPEQPDSE